MSSALIKKFTVEDLKKSITKGEVKPVYLFDGTEEFLKNEIIQKIKKAFLNKDTLLYNFDQLSGKSCTASDLLEKVSTFPFLAQKRILIVHDVDKLKDATRKALLPYLENPARFTCLIFTTREFLKDTTFINKMQIHGAQVTFWPLWDSQFLSEIRALVSRKNKKIDEHALHLLHEAVGGSLAQLNNEVEKLVDYTAGRTHIEADDVIQVVSAKKGAEVQAGVDAFIKKIRNETMVLARELLLEKENLSIFVAILFRYLKLMLYGKEMQKQEVKDIAQQLKVPYKQRGAFQSALDTWTVEQIAQAIAHLLRLDSSFKGKGSSAYVDWELQEFLTHQN